MTLLTVRRQASLRSGGVPARTDMTSLHRYGICSTPVGYRVSAASAPWTTTGTRVSAGGLLATGMLLFIAASDARAVCNVIPSVANSFRGTRGALDRPFAKPGDFVDIGPGACGTGAAAFLPEAADHVVTIVFTPPHTTARHVVVLAAHCSAVEASRQNCEARGDVASVTCREVEVDRLEGPIGLEVVERDAVRHLRFRFPDTDSVLRACSGGANEGDPCTVDGDCGGGGNCVDGVEDDITLTGPATIAVTSVEANLPCVLASSPCSEHPDIAACVDELFAIDGTCGTTPHETFSHFTALPPPNDYQALCETPNTPCTGAADEIRLTVDVQGNILVPMDWRGVLVRRNEVPLARLVRGSTSAEAFQGQGIPIRIPDVTAVGSYSPEGTKLPPLFDPQVDPSDPDVVSFFGSADAPEGVLRLARRDATNEATCENGGCELFDFSDRLLAGIGPVVISRGRCLGGSTPRATCTNDSGCPGGQCGEFRAQALDPVPLDGLNQSDELNAFVVAEGVANEDLNGDGDTTDDVVELAERATGEAVIGRETTRPRAVVRIRQPPFSFPAVALEGNVLAFLESEPAQYHEDANRNGRVFETILKVFELGRGQRTDEDRAITADASPVINGRSLVVSNGLVFFRTAEAANARQMTERVSVASNGNQQQGTDGSRHPSISGDGRFVAFLSFARGLAPGGANFCGSIAGPCDVFVHDRVTRITERISTAFDGGHVNDFPGVPWMSADGRFVTFAGPASNLVPNDTNGTADVFMHDYLGSGATERINLRPDQSQSGGASVDSQQLGISADGRFVTFASEAGGLVPEDQNILCRFLPDAFRCQDVFVRDRAAHSSERASVATDNTDANDFSLWPSMSADGRFIVFTSSASNLVPDGAAGQDVYVRDRVAGTTERVSIATDGIRGNAGSISERGSISADGRFVAFTSHATNLVPGDTNGIEDAFVHDRQTGTNERVSIASDGSQAAAFTGAIGAALSADGRLVAFASDATNLVPGDTNVCGTLLNRCLDVFVHDRLTGFTERVSVASDGSQGEGDFIGADFDYSISADGRFVAFNADFSNLVPGDTNGIEDVFVRGVDPTDLAVDKDLNSDGDVADTVLRVLATADADAAPATLGPADEVSAMDGNAAFLRPEAAGAPGSPTGIDLNGDGDTKDLVVHLWRTSGPAENLSRAAARVSLSRGYVAALISEAAQGNSDLNGDVDTDDNVLAVNRIGEHAWRNVRQAADCLGTVASIVVIITPEEAEGKDLNADGDVHDRVLQIYDADAGSMLMGESAPIRAETVQEFALGGAPGTELVAFRTESNILKVYDRSSARLIDTHQTVRPCRLEACDPRIPFRVGKDTVTFLTLESDQQEDLNGDDDRDDLVVQVLNVRVASGSTSMVGARHILGASSGGVCTTTGMACATDESCVPGSCFVPPGGCIQNLGRTCDPRVAAACGRAGTFCQPTLGVPGLGRCMEVLEPKCSSDADCRVRYPTATCSNSDQRVQRLVSPLTSQASTKTVGAKVFTSSGRCVEDLAVRCDPTAAKTGCRGGAFCEPDRDGSHDGTCKREHRACARDADCPGRSECRHTLLTATANDADEDEVPDPFDNCPKTSNIMQEDGDDDGVGDACDSSSSTPCDDGRGCFEGALCALADDLEMSACAGQRLPQFVARWWDRARRTIERAEVGAAGQARSTKRRVRNAVKLLRGARRVVARAERNRRIVPACAQQLGAQFDDALDRTELLVRNLAACIASSGGGMPQRTLDE